MTRRAADISRDLIDEVQARTSLVELIGRQIALERRGREHLGLCPFHQEKTPSFTVNDDKGFFHCFGCGVHGDAITFLMRHDGLPFGTAVIRLAVDAGLATNPDNAARPLKPKVPRPTPDQVNAEKVRSIEKALGGWRESRPAIGTMVEVYLGSRGITLTPPPSLRFHPRLAYYDTDPKNQERFRLAGHWPAMIGGVQGPDGEITGIHRTYLARDGANKAPVKTAKKMAGICWGGAVRFAKAGPTLIIAEGIETTLSLAQAFPELPTWAALSLGNLAGAGKGRGAPHPRLAEKILPDPEPDMERPGLVLPDAVREVIIAADADNGDPESAEALLQRAAQRFAAQARAVRIARAPVGFDFNDVLLWPDNVVALPVRRSAA